MRVLLGTVAALLVAASSAVAADLPVKARPMVVDTWTWNGFYIGLNGGYSWGRSRSDAVFIGPTGVITPPAGSVTSANFNLNGGVFGGQAGWNWQTGNWVWGFETDLQWSRERGSAAFFCSATPLIGGVCVPGATFLPAGALGTSVTMEQTIDWFGTLRGRAGMLLTPSVLAYVTGGLAFGGVKTNLAMGSFNANGTAVAATSSNTSTHAGWVFGGGVEAMFTRNWSGKLEYLHMDLGSFDSTVALTAPAISASVHSRVTDNIFRAGINYHFDAGPVVARY